MKIKVMNIGVISREDYQQRTIAIAKGTYKPRKGGKLIPKVIATDFNVKFGLHYSQLMPEPDLELEPNQ